MRIMPLRTEKSVNFFGCIEFMLTFATNQTCHASACKRTRAGFNFLGDAVH